MALQDKNHYERSRNKPDEDTFLQNVKDNLKTLLKYDGTALDTDLHIQSYNDPTHYLGDQNGFSSLIAGPRTTSLIIWRFVYVPTGAGVFYTYSEGQYWHFYNTSNPHVSLEEIQQLEDPSSFGTDPSDVFIIVDGINNQKFIQPYYHQNMYVQYDATIQNPVTLDVTTSTEPDGAFTITEVLELKSNYNKAALAVFGVIIAIVIITCL